MIMKKTIMIETNSKIYSKLISSNIWIFDCDGVLFQSNVLKRKAFFDSVVLNMDTFGQLIKLAERNNIGKNRNIIFDAFLDDILTNKKLLKKKLLNSYSEIVSDIYSQSEPSELFLLRRMFPNKKWCLVSSAPSKDINTISEQIKQLFDSGIFTGSHKKETLLSSEIMDSDENKIVFGDTFVDLNLSNSLNAEFLFFYGDSNLPSSDIKELRKNHLSVANLMELTSVVSKIRS